MGGGRGGEVIGALEERIQFHNPRGGGVGLTWYGGTVVRGSNG